MGLIDITVIVTILLSVLFALYRGLVRELLGITAWILAGLSGLYSYSFMQPLMHKWIESESIAGLTGAGTVALIVLIIMTLINAKITSKLRKSSLSGLDRILGFAFGIVRAWLLIGFVYIAASMVMSDKQLAEVEKKNYSMHYVAKMAEVLERFIPETMKKDIKSYEQGRLKDKDMKKIGKQIGDNAAEYNRQAREALDKLIEEKGDISSVAQ